MLVENFQRAKHPEPYSSLLRLGTGAFCWLPEMLGLDFTALKTNDRRSCPIFTCPSSYYDLKEAMDVVQKCEP